MIALISKIHSRIPYSIYNYNHIHKFNLSSNTNHQPMIISLNTPLMLKSTSINYRSFYHTLSSAYKFSTNKQKRQLISQQTLQQFKQLLQENTNQSLDSGAELLAELECQVEGNEQNIKNIELELEQCSPGVKYIAQKMQIIQANIKQQEEQILAIQKRAQKEIQDCRKFAVSTVAKEILDVADSLTKCKKTSIQSHTHDTDIVKSIEKADEELKKVFLKYGIKEFDPTGEDYNPNQQQALTTIPVVKQGQKNKVAFTSRTAYTIQGRLLRSAHVGIYQ